MTPQFLLKYWLDQWRFLAMRLLLTLLVMLFGSSALSDFELPALTGRITDRANLVSSETEAVLSTQLQQLEAQTRVQLMVVTVPSLQGYAIEYYGYQLRRHWGAGTPEFENAAILITAQKDHAIRIEVGAGLKGMLTDTINANIITQIIEPSFRQGRFDDGIKRGVEAIGQVIHGDYLPIKPSQQAKQNIRIAGWVIFILMLIVVLRSLRRGCVIHSRNRRLIAGGSKQESVSRSNGGIGDGRFGGGGAVGRW